jgi:hypothetical protein
MHVVIYQVACIPCGIDHMAPPACLKGRAVVFFWVSFLF